MTAALAALVTLLETTPSVLLVDLFATDEPIQPSLGNRSYMKNDDPDVIRAHVGLTKQEELELILRKSR